MNVHADLAPLENSRLLPSTRYDLPVINGNSGSFPVVSPTPSTTTEKTEKCSTVSPELPLKRVIPHLTRARATCSLVLAVLLSLVPQVSVAQAVQQTVTPKKLLTLITTAPELARNGYARSLFEHWVDDDNDGCDTREEVLVAEAVTAPDLGPGCRLTGGSWRSIYDGVVTSDPSRFDVDHVVALAEAWDSGAARWDSRTRRAFANDLNSDFSLVAVSAGSNRSKSDKDLAQWSPASRKAQCWLMTATLVTKYRWSLQVDRAERASLTALVGRCPSTSFTMPTRAKVTSTGPVSPSPAPSPTDRATPTAEKTSPGAVNSDGLEDSPATPAVDGNCPTSHPVKGNINSSSKIYHEPSSPWYDITRAEQCFRDSSAAKSGGYRPPRT
jgi:hypothetical protein